MRKKITTINHLKNRIVLATYIFRSLPVWYLNTIAIDEAEKSRIKLILLDLIRYGFLKKKESIHEMQYLSLTKQGYDYLVTEVLKSPHDPMYKYKPVRSVRQSVSEHGYMNFAYVWNYIKEHADSITNEIRIYDDSNLNHCKMPFSFAGKRAVLVPDILIHNTQGSASRVIFIENDTGREEYLKIFKKLVEYAAFAQNAKAENAIDTIELYFILASQKRIDQMFYSPNGIIQLFDNYNHSEKIRDVPIDVILRAFQKDNVKLYLSLLNYKNTNVLYDFQQFNLTEQLLTLNPAWKYLV